LLFRVALFLTAALLASCGARPEGSIGGDKPVDAYVAMGGRIKSCWFNPVDPLLPSYVYRADVSPDGSKVTISIHERELLGRAGLTTYIVDFKQEGPSTAITTDNRKMPPDLAAKMQFDIDRWKRGEPDCSKERPKATAAPPSPPAPAAAH
jgi:hypothetical protein